MNNFNNQYVDPDSFQDEKYDNYRNATYPDNTHFSVNQGGSKKNETQQSQKSNQNKKHSININHQLESINPKPVLYPPPKVDWVQNRNPIDMLAFNNTHSKDSENAKMDKKEVVSDLIKEFSHMLDDTTSSSIHGRFTTLREDKFENETSLNSDESTFAHTERSNSEMLFAEFFSILDESSDHLISEGKDIKSLKNNNEPIEDKFFAMLSESGELEEKIEVLNENNDRYEDGFSTKPSDICDLIEKQESDKNEEDVETVNENNYTNEDKFFSMLLESDEMQEDQQDRDTNEEDIEPLSENNDTNEDKFFSMLLESDEMKEDQQDRDTNEEDIEPLNENNDTSEDKFFSMLLESDEMQEDQQDSDTNEEDVETLSENNDTNEDKFYSMLLESDEMQEDQQDSNNKVGDIEKLNGNIDTNEDKFFSMLSESNELQEDQQENLVTNMKGPKSKETGDSFKGELYKKTSFKKGKKRKYCINKSYLNNGACLNENSDERFFQKNSHIIDPIEKKKTTNVKMKVLLSRLETDVDIVETIDLAMPLEHILNVEWFVQLHDCKIILPSKTVFLKGEFTAEIEFCNKDFANKTQLLKIIIPWSKTENINWLSIPDFSYSNQNELMFQTQHDYNPSFHYESYRKFAEPIQSQLNQFNFVWFQELNSKEKQLHVNGVAQLYIHFMQEQFVELDCYSK